jgi:hypothetical protein
MPLNRRFEISPNVISTEAQLDETLLMNTRTLAYFGLDPLGSKFWQAMMQNNESDEVVRKVSEETGKTAMELEPVLSAILDGMERSGLLESQKY